MVNYVLIGLSAALFVSGIGLAIYIADAEGQLDFLQPAHYISLLIFLLAYILTWVGMTWMTNPDKFEVRPKQWVAFGFTILMAVFWWGRYIFTIADTAETKPS
tara:strand:+ start:118 stop:426 length:309 start_codon:yes stop_codon:yes gene_type:complete